MKREPIPAISSGTAWRLGLPAAFGATDWQAAPLDQVSASGGEHAFLVFLPSGATTPYDEQQRAEAWTHDTPVGALRLDLLFRGDRIIWTPRRMLALGAPERLPDIMAALALFTRAELELTALEHAAAGNLSEAEGDVAFTHAVTAADLRQQRRIGMQTQAAHVSRIRLTRIETLLARPGERASGPARRLLSELALQAEVPERMRILDEQIEVCQDIYDTANDRLTEFSHFLREYRMEMLIVAVLALEVALVVLDLFLNSA